METKSIISVCKCVLMITIGTLVNYARTYVIRDSETTSQGTVKSPVAMVGGETPIHGYASSHAPPLVVLVT